MGQNLMSELCHQVYICMQRPLSQQFLQLGLGRSRTVPAFHEPPLWPSSAHPGRWGKRSCCQRDACLAQNLSEHPSDPTFQVRLFCFLCWCSDSIQTSPGKAQRGPAQDCGWHMMENKQVFWKCREVNNFPQWFLWTGRSQGKPQLNSNCPW